MRPSIAMRFSARTFFAPVTRQLRLNRDSYEIPDKYKDWTMTKFFENKPPWWARYGHGIIMFFGIFGLSFSQNLWYNWTEEIRPQAVERARAKMGPNADAEPTPPVEPPAEPESAYERRPYYQRIGAIVLVVSATTAMVMTLNTARNHCVRRLFLLSPQVPKRSPPPLVPTPFSSKKGRKGKAPPRLEDLPSTHTHLLARVPIVMQLQSASDSGSYGQLVPLENCLLSRGREADELFVKVEGLRGTFFLSLKGGEVFGKKYAKLDEAHEAFMKGWLGEAPKGGA